MIESDLQLELLVAIAAGIVFGLLVRQVVRSRAATELATLSERLSARDEQVAAARGELAASQARTERLAANESDLRSALAAAEARLVEEQARVGERAALLEAAETKLTDAFAGLAGRALAANAESFMLQARQSFAALQSSSQGDLEQRRQAIEGLVTPLREQLGRYEVSLRELERTRQEAYGGLAQQVRGLLVSQEKLQLETGNLVKALRAPQVRGRWGEMQLKRAVEFAGLVDRVDFVEQETTDTDAGRQRPDMVVMLPGGKTIVVDAKAPLDAFLAAVEAKDEDQRRLLLIDHARQVRDHIRKLAAKSYWEQFESAPDFVVLFLPGEMIFSAALEHDPTLIEEAFRQSVVLATPTTLVALLKSVAYGWRQEDLALNARRIAEEARVLYDRVRVFAEHLDRVGKGLETAVKAHNEAAGSFALRVVPQGRRLEELSLGPEKQLEAPRQVEVVARSLGIGEPAEEESPNDLDELT